MDESRSELAGSRYSAVAKLPISASIGVDLLIPQKPTLTTARWSPAWQDDFVT
jgi:hypothetical protein